MQSLEKTKFFNYSLLKQKIFVWLLYKKNIKIMLFILFGILGYQSLEILDLKTQKKDQNILFSIRSKSDFEDYYNASKTLKDKKSPYYEDRIINFLENIPKDLDLSKISENINLLKGAGSYLYPPLFAFLILPLTNFSYKISAFIYQIFQLILLLLSLFFLFRIPSYMDIKISKRKVYLSVFLSLFAYFPLQVQNISNGNVGFILIFFISFSFYLYYKYNNIFYDFVNGIVIGLATVIKIIPGFVVGFYFIRKRYKIIIGMIIGILLGILLPALYLGFEENLQIFKTWYTLIIKTYQKYSVVRPYANNQTISGALCKLLIPFSDFKQFQYGLPLSFINLSTLQVSLMIKLINNFILFNVVLITLLLYFKKQHNYFIFLLYLYFVLLSALLTSGISWYHTYGLLLIVYFFYFIYKYKYLKKHLKIFIIPVIYIWVFNLLPYRIKDFFSLYSFYTWINLIILIYLMINLYKYIFTRDVYGKV